MMKDAWGLILAFALLVGCTTTAPMASAASDAAAKSFVVPEGKANLYIARAQSAYGGGALFKVLVDGQAQGSLAEGTFYLVAVDPGRHKIEVRTMANSDTASLDAAAGKNYFYELTATSGTSGVKPSLSLVLFEKMGQMMIRQGKLAQGSGE
jgi:hypothetical protein